MKSAITAAVVVMAATALTWAQGGDKVSPPAGDKGPAPAVEHRLINQDERFKQMDKNGNGVIDKDEFKGPPEMFSKIDADNSGTITKEELQAAHEKRGLAPKVEAPKKP